MITKPAAIVLTLLISFHALAEAPTVTVGPPLDGVKTLSAMREHRRGRAKAKVIAGAVILGYGFVAGLLGFGLGMGVNFSHSDDVPLYNIALASYGGWELGAGLIVGASLLGVGAKELRENSAPTAPIVSLSF